MRNEWGHRWGPPGGHRPGRAALAVLGAMGAMGDARFAMGGHHGGEGHHEGHRGAGPFGPGPFGEGRRGERGRGPGGRGPGGMGGPGGRGRREEAPPSTQGLAGWLAGRLPGDWFTGPVDLVVDRDEVTVTGTLPDLEDAPEEPAERAEAERGRVQRFRETTRAERVAIAEEVESRWGRSVAWGARLGAVEEVFTRAAVPAMTRLRQPERVVLDTLVDAGVARSRSEALAWCVRLVGEHTEDWLASLRAALGEVERVRESGPAGTPTEAPTEAPTGPPTGARPDAGPGAGAERLG